MQFQSGVSVEVASVTGVLGAGEEVAVDFGLEDGTDEVGGVVVVVGGGTEVTVTTVVETFGEVTTVDGTVAGVDFAADALVIRRSKGDSALFATAPLIESVDAVARIGRVQEADRVWLGDAAPVLPAAFLGVATMVLDGEGPAALFAAAELVPDNDGRTIARDAISAAVVLPSVLAPGVDTKPAARNSSARTASVRAKRGRTHSLPPSVASQSR
jgi:hypothetical protein